MSPKWTKSAPTTLVVCRLRLPATLNHPIAQQLSGFLTASAWSTIRNGWSAALVVLLMILYWPSLSGPYLFDDIDNIVTNEVIETFPPNLSWHRAESRPLVMLSFAIENGFFGKWPAASRFVNVLVHAIAATLFAELIFRLAKDRWPSKTVAFCALAIATLWAVHPLQTQSVAYIVQRSESLMGLFFFAFLLAIVLHDRTCQRKWLIIGLIFFLAGLWSKTIMVSALAVGPLMDRAWLSDSWKQVFAKRSSLYLPPVAAAAIAITTLIPGLLRGDANVGFGGDAPPALPYLAAQAKVIPTYLAMAIVPTGLNIDHGLTVPRRWTDNAFWMIAMAVVALAGVASCAAARWKFGFFLLSPLLVLAPTSSLIPTADLMVEHRMYVPLAFSLAGLFAIAIELQHPIAIPKRVKLVSAAGLVAVGTLFCLLTWDRASDYQSGSRLWIASVRQNPGNPRASQNLTSAAREEGRESELLDWFAALLTPAIANGQPTAVLLGRIGEELVKRGEASRAIAPLQRAIAEDPPIAMFNERFVSPSQKQELAAHHVNYGIALMQTDRMPEAADQLSRAFTISDTSPDARAIAGDLQLRLGELDKAVEHFQRALELRPQWPDVKRELQRIRELSKYRDDHPTVAKDSAR